MPHLKHIGIENFRLFKNPTNFELAPLTVLTGTNNSGKSSLIKLLKLLSGSFSITKSLDELRFDSGNHNLGDFNEILPWNSKKKHLSIIIPIPLKYFDDSFDVELKYRLNSKQSSRLFYFKIFNKKRTLVEYFYDLKMSELYSKRDREKILSLGRWDSDMFNTRVNGILNLDYKYLINMALKNRELIELGFQLLDEYEEMGILEQLPSDEEIVKQQNTKAIDENKNSAFNSFYSSDAGIIPSQIGNPDIFEIHEDQLLFNFYKKDTLIENGSQLYDKVFDTYQKFLNGFSNMIWPFQESPLDKGALGSFYLFINQLAHKLSSDIQDVVVKKSELGNIVFHELLNSNIKGALERIDKIFHSLNSLSTYRGDQSRVYSESGSLDLNDILHEYSLLASKLKKKDEVISFLNDKLLELKIGERIDINRIENSATFIKIKLPGKQKPVSLSELGFGFSQIIPILLKVVIIALDNRYEGSSGTGYTPTILMLEEPEANLHPDLQSQLADVIVDAARNFNIQFIIETHSEYFIRKLQLLTAKGELKPRNTKILYFNNPDNQKKGEKQVKALQIREDGLMNDDFGEGFFDESTRLTIELLKHQNKN